MIVAAAVIDKLAILHLLEQAELHRGQGGSLAIMPDGSTHVNAQDGGDGSPPTRTFDVWVGPRAGYMKVECERVELAARSRRAYVYHLAEREMPRWRDAVALEQRSPTELTPGDGGERAPQDEDGPARVRREWAEAITGNVRSSRDLEVARGRYVEMLTALGMTDEDAERASEKAASRNPVVLVKRFAPEAYYEMVQGWKLDVSSCHYTLTLMHWSIILSKYGGQVTLYRANRGVHTSEVSIALSHMEMIKASIEVARAFINEHEAEQARHEVHDGY